MWKYIIVRTGAREIPFIFPNHMVHSMMLDAVRCYFVEEAKILSGGWLPDESYEQIRNAVEVVSAGGVTAQFLGASGFSTSLGVNSRLEDSGFINSYPYTGGHDAIA